jgi:hypothetical protein
MMYQPYGRPLPPGNGRQAGVPTPPVTPGFSPVAGQANGQRRMPMPGPVQPSPQQDFDRVNALSRLQGRGMATPPVQQAAQPSPVANQGQGMRYPMRPRLPQAPTGNF